MKYTKSIIFIFIKFINDSITITYPRKISNDLYLKIGYNPLDVEALKKDEKFLILANKTIEMRMHKLKYYTTSKSRIDIKNNRERI